MYRAPEASSPARAVRAAIYTRVSTDESLGMEFNSLDAQREACEAYIISQRHEGWAQVATRYDDGGYSGGSMKRPALERLLADVREGQVDTIVVYKIDRLTRSLADFSRIVDVLDAHSASFISITQAFSTTTSMGRLTLNVLLSFAQFEREVGAERVRDKIASSKKKGMWMGGVVPLGYDARDRKLIANGKEAATVRHIFERYIELRSAMVLEQELRTSGVVSKRRVAKSGKVTGGSPFTRGALYNLLQNVTYIGKVAHKDQVYPGQHEAILDHNLFQQAQTILAVNRAKRRHGNTAHRPSILAGLLFDERGGRLSPSHATKGSKRFRYYVARNLGDNDTRRYRVPAGSLERLVVGEVRDWLSDGHRVESTGAGTATDAVAVEALLFAASRAAAEFGSASPSRSRELLLALVDRIIVSEGEVHIKIRPEELHAFAGLPSPESRLQTVTLQVSCTLVRRSREVRLAVVPKDSSDARVDPSLVKLIVKAHAARTALFAGLGASLAQVAAQQGHEPHYFSVLVKLSYLAPDLTEAILEGRQPLRLDRQALARIRKLPMCWNGQRQLFESYRPGS